MGCDNIPIQEITGRLTCNCAGPLESVNYGLDELVERMVQHSPGNRVRSVDEVKQQLIARKNDFISRQKLDDLRREVVPSSTPSRPFFENPPRVVDLDIQGSVLTLILDKKLPAKWIEAFKTPRAISFINGTGPESWNFEQFEDRTRAWVCLPTYYLQPATAQPIIDNFKGYVEFANTKFRQNLEIGARMEEEDRRKALQERVAAEEKRRKLRESLRI